MPIVFFLICAHSHALIDCSVLEFVRLFLSSFDLDISTTPYSFYFTWSVIWGSFTSQFISFFLRGRVYAWSNYGIQLKVYHNHNGSKCVVNLSQSHIS